MARLHDEKNLRFAGVAVIVAAFLVGAVAGTVVEGAVCTARPAIARIGMTLGALLIIALDVALRATHRDAAERLGSRRFVDPPSGARIGGFLPAWMAGAGLLAYCLQDGARHGFC